MTEQTRPLGWAVYHDPVIGSLLLPPLLRQAIDLRAVQRLRSIRQLSGLDLVYPGATHTRFEHSVGVMWLAGQAHDVLAQKSFQRRAEGTQPAWPVLGPETKLAVMLAGLLHDVGHGPYSHTHEMYREREDALERRHADRSFSLIARDNEEIQLFLFRVYARLDSLPLRELLLPSSVATLVQNERLPGHLADWTFLGSVVNGIFDVDRLDYLRRDAFHTGVPLGVDPGEIISAYWLADVSLDEPSYQQVKERPTTDDDIAPSPLTWALKLESNAALAIERMLSTRDTAYRKLYYHPTHRAVQEMLILSMQRLTNREPERAGTRVEPSDLDTKTDAELMAAVESAKSDPLLRELYVGLRDRRLYEPLDCTLRVDQWPQKAISGLKDLRGGANVRLRTKMLEVATTMGLETGGEHPQRIIVDVARTPVVDELAYRRRYLWREPGKSIDYFDDDPVRNPTGVWRTARTGFSLLELLPHLRARHGVQDRDSGPPLDHHLQYVQQIQEILFFVSPGFMDLIHAELRVDDGSDRIERVYSSRLEPILRGLWSLLEGKFRDSESTDDRSTENGEAMHTQAASEEWHDSFAAAGEQLREWLRSDSFPVDGSRRH